MAILEEKSTYKKKPDYHFQCLEVSWKFSGGCKTQEESHWIHPVM